MVVKTYKFKESKKQTKTTNDNLKGDLLVAITDRNENTIQKIELNKKKEGDKYIINPILNLEILQKKVLSQTSMRKLLKGFKLEFKQLDRKTKTTKPIELSLVDKKNINVRLLYPFKDWKFRVIYSGTNEIRTIKPPQNFNFTGSYEELEENIHSYIYRIFDWIPEVEDDNPDFIISIKLLESIEFIDKNNVVSQFHFKRHNDDENYYIEKKRKYAELVNLFNEPIQAVNNPSDENCVVYYFNELYKTGQFIYNNLEWAPIRGNRIQEEPTGVGFDANIIGENSIETHFLGSPNFFCALQ
jgi:hypothetical protein